MNDTHAKCIGYLPEAPAPWRDAAPAHHGGELVPYLRQLATRFAAESRGRKEDFAYWQAADRIEDLRAALEGFLTYHGGHVLTCPELAVRIRDGYAAIARAEEGTK